MKKIIQTNSAPQAVGAYSQGVEINGTYFFSGQIGLDPKTMELANGFDNQLNQVLKNIEALLNHCHLKKEDILKTTIFMTDLSLFPKVNQAYEEFFSKPFPARSTVEVKGLPKGALVEIEVIAFKNH